MTELDRFPWTSIEDSKTEKTACVQWCHNIAADIPFLEGQSRKDLQKLEKFSQVLAAFINFAEAKFFFFFLLFTNLRNFYNFQQLYKTSVTSSFLFGMRASEARIISVVEAIKW